MAEQLLIAPYDPGWVDLFAGLADRQAYVVAKVPFTWETIHMADDWAQVVGWEPGPSDG